MLLRSSLVPIALVLGCFGLSARAQTTSAPSASIGADENGYALRSSDGGYALRIRGDAQADGRFYLGDDEALATDQWYLRRARLLLQATLAGRYDVRLQPNFGQGRVEIQDAYLNMRLHPAANVQAGKFKVPLGLEWHRSPTDLALVERGLPSSLVPRRDVGVMLHGAVAAGRLGYELGVFNGPLDGQSADGDAGDGKDLAGRLFAQPFRAPRGPLRGLGVGFGATLGSETGTAAAPALAGYRASGGRPILRYRATGVDSTTAQAAGRRARYSPQAYYYSGPLSLMGEYVASRQRTRLGREQADLAASAWQVQGTWMLTGEAASYGRIRPRRPLGSGGAGAFEVAARVGALAADERAFPRFAQPATQARTARALAVGVNWYPSAQVKWMANVERTTFGLSVDAPAGSALPPETVLLTRIQVAF